MRSPAVLVALGLALAGLGCVSLAPPTPAQRIEAWRASSVSPETWERVRPYVEALVPGDELRIFEAAREVHMLGRGPRSRPVVVIPAWISSLSGGAAGGASMLGQLTARSGDRVYGSHVFGYLREGRIVPRYQLVTTASLIDAETFAQLASQRVRGIGVLPRPSGMLYFHDLYVAGGRQLEFPDPDTDLAGASGSAEPNESNERTAPDVAAFFSEAAYRKASPVLDSLPPGTDLLSMLWLLEAEFVSEDFGETHSLRAPGFLHYKQIRTVTQEGPEGIFKLRPFGWVEDDREIVKRVAVFENDRLRGVVPYVGFTEVAPYLTAAPAEPEEAAVPAQPEEEAGPEEPTGPSD